jgi:hypothetical protein
MKLHREKVAVCMHLEGQVCIASNVHILVVLTLYGFICGFQISKLENTIDKITEIAATEPCLVSIFTASPYPLHPFTLSPPFRAPFIIIFTFCSHAESNGIYRHKRLGICAFSWIPPLPIETHLCTFGYRMICLTGHMGSVLGSCTGHLYHLLCRCRSHLRLRLQVGSMCVCCYLHFIHLAALLAAISA